MSKQVYKIVLQDVETQTVSTKYIDADISIRSKNYRNYVPISKAKGIYLAIGSNLGWYRILNKTPVMNINFLRYWFYKIIGKLLQRNKNYEGSIRCGNVLSCKPKEQQEAGKPVISEDEIEWEVRKDVK